MSAGKTMSAEKMEPIHISTTLVAGTNRRIMARARHHEILMDVSTRFGGDDAGPTPPECLAMALGGCVMNFCGIIALEREIELSDIQITIVGDIDPTRASGIQTEERAGFSEISVELKMSSKLTEAQKEDFLAELISRCPLCDTIGNPTPFRIRFAE